MYVLAATPLIYMARAESLSLLDRLPEPCCIPDRVSDAVVREGVEEGYPEPRRIERAIAAGTLDVRETPETQTFERLRSTEQLSDGDRAVLALAVAEGGIAMMDDRYGCAIARAEGIPVQGTASLVLDALDRGELTFAEARATIDDLVAAGWNCSTGHYATVLRRIDELSA